MRRRVAILAAAALLAILPATSPRIEEDDPRWNCSTMGNMICGPVQAVPAAAINAALADEWPDCAAACHDEAARLAVLDAHAQAGPGVTCWAEDTAATPWGWAVVCT